MSDLSSLYQELIVDHGKSPRNVGVLEKATHCHEGYNPLCGDKVKLYVNEQAGLLQALRFEGKGCAVSMAAASLMIESIEGKTRAEVEQVAEDFHTLVTNKEHEEILETRLGKLAAFKNIAEFPARVKCATLAWHTLKAALAGELKSVRGCDE